MADEQVPLLGSDNQDSKSNMVTLNSRIIQPASPPISMSLTTPVPSTIAHRGYKSHAPENTMLAFRLAAEDGEAGAIETDLHLTRDGVVVLSHDADLGRCYGLPGVKLKDRDWKDLRDLRTTQEPHEPMPRLRDLLEWLDGEGRGGMWVMLDIKRHDDAEELVRRTAETIASVPATQRPWSERITPCCWDAKYIRLCLAHLPGFRITHVGHSTAYARALVDQVPGLSVSMLRHALAAPLTGPRFLRDMRARGVPVHAWTVNEEGWMEWCVRKRLAGVITDDPKRFRDVCRRMGDGDGKPEMQVEVQRERVARSVVKGAWFGAEMLLFHILLVLFAGTTWLRHGSPRRRVREELRG